MNNSQDFLQGKTSLEFCWWPWIQIVLDDKFYVLLNFTTVSDYITIWNPPCCPSEITLGSGLTYGCFLEMDSAEKRYDKSGFHPWLKVFRLDVGLSLFLLKFSPGRRCLMITSVMLLQVSLSICKFPVPKVGDFFLIGIPSHMLQIAGCSIIICSTYLGTVISNKR